MLEKNRHQDNTSATTAIDLRHTIALNNGGKMKICKKRITPLKLSDKKNLMKTRIGKRSHTDNFKQGIKGPDIIVNLVWANSFISGYIMHNSAGTVVGNL